MYTSPDDEAGNFEPSHLVSSMQQQYVDDDQQMLLDIEQNIANLERSKDRPRAFTVKILLL